jgi:C4-dicarboxylate-specific signal transduction histidine kinase
VRVLLTGQASLNGAMAAVNEGNIFRFLSKPCPPSVLLQALEDALEQSRLVTQDRELIERKLQKMSGHLLRAERLASLGTMSAAVAHELNNMLMVFNGGLSALRSDAAAGKVANLEDLELLEEVRGRIARHASHLLHLGRVPQSESTTADVGLVVLATLEMLRVGGALRRTRIDLDLPETSVEVRLGKTELEQVVLNLVKNAAEALAEMGKPDASITVTVRRGEGSAATCSIADNGPGIAARDLQLIFEPYFTTKSPERGTGLGLFVVRQICRDAGGDVVVSSTPGEGTKFTLSLPVA